MDGSSTIVVVEDGTHIADLVDLYLGRDGFRVWAEPVPGATPCAAA